MMLKHLIFSQNSFGEQENLPCCLKAALTLFFNSNDFILKLWYSPVNILTKFIRPSKLKFDPNINRWQTGRIGQKFRQVFLDF